MAVNPGFSRSGGTRLSGRPSAGRIDEVGELPEKVAGVVGARGGFRMVLDAENRVIAVPEPNRVLLLASATAGLVLLSRRRLRL